MGSVAEACGFGPGEGGDPPPPACWVASKVPSELSPSVSASGHQGSCISMTTALLSLCVHVRDMLAHVLAHVCAPTHIHTRTGTYMHSHAFAHRHEHTCVRAHGDAHSWGQGHSSPLGGSGDVGCHRSDSPEHPPCTGCSAQGFISTISLNLPGAGNTAASLPASGTH